MNGNDKSLAETLIQCQGRSCRKIELNFYKFSGRGCKLISLLIFSDIHGFKSEWL